MEQNGVNGKAVAALVLGIVAIVMSCCTWFISIPCGVVGLVLGIMVMKNEEEGRNMALAGVICSIVSLALSVLMIIAGAALRTALGI